MKESTRMKAWLTSSAAVVGLVALVAAPGVIAASKAKTLTGNVISYRPPSGSTSGRLVVRTGAGNITLAVPEKLDRTLRTGWTVTVTYKAVENKKKNKKSGKTVVVSSGLEVTKKATVLNSGTGDIFDSSVGGSESGGGSGSGTKAGG